MATLPNFMSQEDDVEDNEKNTNDETGFSAEYVKQLREENASWRRKVRDLEKAQVKSEVGIEFAKRGLDIDPSWLSIPEGVSPAEAADQIIQGLGAANRQEVPIEEEEAPQERVAYPRALPSNANKANVPGPPAQGAYGGRSIEEIKKDPQARSRLRDQYRDLLRGDQPPENYFS